MYFSYRKEYLHHEYNKKPAQCVFIWNVRNYCTCIHVPNCYWEITHTQSNLCYFMFLTSHSQDITWCLSPQFVAQNFIKGVQKYSCTFLCNYWKDDLKTDSTNIWLHFATTVFKRTMLIFAKSILICSYK